MATLRNLVRELSHKLLARERVLRGRFRRGWHAQWRGGIAIRGGRVYLGKNTSM